MVVVKKLLIITFFILSLGLSWSVFAKIIPFNNQANKVYVSKKFKGIIPKKFVLILPAKLLPLTSMSSIDLFERYLTYSTYKKIKLLIKNKNLNTSLYTNFFKTHKNWYKASGNNYLAYYSKSDIQDESNIVDIILAAPKRQVKFIYIKSRINALPINSPLNLSLNEKSKIAVDTVLNTVCQANIDKINTIEKNITKYRNKRKHNIKNPQNFSFNIGNCTLYVYLIKESLNKTTHTSFIDYAVKHREK